MWKACLPSKWPLINAGESLNTDGLLSQVVVWTSLVVLACGLEVYKTKLKKKKKKKELLSLFITIQTITNQKAQLNIAKLTETYHLC